MNDMPLLLVVIQAPDRGNGSSQKFACQQNRNSWNARNMPISIKNLNL